MSSKKPSLLALHPSDKLQFTLSGDGVGPKCILKLTNTSSSRLAFKVKTTHRNRYLVRPNQALLDVEGTAEVEVLIQGKAADGIVKEAKSAGKEIPCTDKFLVQVLKVPDDFYFTLIDKQPKYQSTALASMFAEVSKSDISNKKLLSQFIYPEDLFNATTNDTPTTTTTTLSAKPVEEIPSIEEEEEEEGVTTPVDSVPDSIASNPVVTSSANTSSQNFTSTDLYDLQQKYEKLLLFTIELTAARDRLQKALQVKEKEIVTMNAELSSEKSKDSGGLRKRIIARDGDSEDKDRSMLEEEDAESEGELLQRKSGFTTVHIVIIAIVCFLIGRLQQTLSS